MELPLTLRIVTPSGVAAEVKCDAVTLTLADDADGRGGGSMGIRRGHETALTALTKGRVAAQAGGKTLYAAGIDSGIASVERDVVTVATEAVRKET